MADETRTSDRPTRAGDGATWTGRIDAVAALLGFDRSQLAVVLLAGLVSVAAVVPAAPPVGLVGLLIALAVWAAVLKLLQYLNALVVAALGRWLPGVMTTALYALAALAGLAFIALEFALRSPSPWSRLVGRFTPEIAVYGVFVVGALAALALGLGKFLGVRVFGKGGSGE